VGRARCQENGAVTKKEIVKQIAERIGETQLKTKDIVQQTFDAIVDTLIEQGRIELRNFGVFEVKQRKARKARNPRTGEKVEVPPKCVVTFKPGKEMEERVRKMTGVPVLSDDEEAGLSESNGTTPESDGTTTRSARPARSRKPAPQRVGEAD
jgi:integration host factor subunit beta